MALFDQIINALTGRSQEAGSSNLVSAIAEVVADKDGGGLSGLVQKFHSAGAGDIISSWIGNGQNQPISEDLLQRVLGSQQVQQLAAKTGLPVDQLLTQLSGHLPGIIDKLTPGGQVPEGGIGQVGVTMPKV